MIPADFPWSAGMLVRTSLHGSHPLGLPGGLPAGTHIRLDGETPEDGESHYMDLLSEGRCSEEHPCVPDLTDGATIGALAGAVREAWGDPYAHAVPLVEGSLVGPPRWRWRVLCAVPGSDPIRRRLRDFVDDDLGAAWLAAWAARPRSST